jgi:hypothetical protein
MSEIIEYIKDCYPIYFHGEYEGECEGDCPYFEICKAIDEMEELK